MGPRRARCSTPCPTSSPCLPWPESSAARSRPQPLVAPTVSSRALTRPNWYARVSVLVGVVALAIGPAAVVASQRVPRVTLLEATGAIAASGLLSLLALLLARRGRLYRDRTLGRAGGPGL